VAQKYVVQYADESFYRNRGRTPRHWIHNATKMSLAAAMAIAEQTGGSIVLA